MANAVFDAMKTGLAALAPPILLLPFEEWIEDDVTANLQHVRSKLKVCLAMWCFPRYSPGEILSAQWPVISHWPTRSPNE